MPGAGDIFITAHAARVLMDRGELSSTDLTKHCLSRISALEDRLHSFLTVLESSALQDAAASDARRRSGTALGPLDGIPIAIKDNISTAGVRTTAGSKILDSYVPPFDAHVVERLRASGAVIVGKANLDEFAMGSSNENSAFGPVRNPWDVNRVPGGSSGGPAAAVSAGEAVVSLGSDTGGSIRQPAALCGIVGMKPTYGLVSRYGLIAFASSLDQIGPFARDVTDCAILLEAISGHDPRDSTSLQRPRETFVGSLRGGIKGVRVGVPREYLVDGIEPGVRRAFESALQTLTSLGAAVEECSLPLTDQALAVYYILAPSEASANLARFDGFKYGHSSPGARTAWDTMDLSRAEGFGSEVKRRILLGGYALSAGYYDAYYKKAQQVRTLIRREFADAFERFDALVTPTSPTVAFKLGSRTQDPLSMYLSDVCTIPVNIAGLPGISLPGGMSDGLPVGLQVIGPQFGDARILRIAYSYEQATEWHLKRPEIN